MVQTLGYRKVNLGEMKLDETDSLIDAAGAPHVISVPGINEDDINRELKDMIAPETSKSSQDFSGYEPLTDVTKFERKALSADADRLIRVLNAIRSRKYDFVICHFFSLDVVQHVWANTPSMMNRWYGIYDDFVGQIQQELFEDDTLVLVSDHGMEKEGIHSKHAFYASTNKIWSDDHRKMEDLKTALELELKTHSYSDQSQVDPKTHITEDTRNHLSDLGYFE